MRAIDVIEGAPFSLEPADARRLETAVERVSAQLRPSFKLLSHKAGRMRLRNVVGTVDLGNGTVVQVAPKVSGAADWGAAVVALLTGDERIDAGGERPAGTSKIHTRLVDAIADAYAGRLERAYRQDGPILAMERLETDSSSLRGKLNVGRWARTAAWRPSVFPVSRTEISADNPYSRLLIEVAAALQRIASTRTRLRLSTIARDLSLGTVARGAGQVPLVRQLPSQWGAYRPAWSLALAILSKTSLFGPTGRHAGMSLAVEAWPLLETALGRTLTAACAQGATLGRRFHSVLQGEVDLATPALGLQGESFSPKPDGRLYEDGKLVACFEAKYAPFNGTMPDRNHIYQAVATAAACRAPAAVLVYPGRHAARAWTLNLPEGCPKHLLALGLDLFKWPAAHADNAAALMGALASVGTCPPLDAVAVA